MKNIFIVLFNINFAQKITFYIGENFASYQPYTFEAFPDFLFNQTIISSQDFNCTADYDCEIISNQVYTLEYQGQYLKYKLARTQLNIIKQCFKEKLTVLYLFQDEDYFGSIVGFQMNSNFLDYLYKQNKLMDYQIIMRIDWNNNLVFKSGVYETDKLPMNYQMKSSFVYPLDSQMKTQNLNFCYSNRKYSQNETYLAIKDTIYHKFRKQILSYYEELQEQNKLVVDELQIKEQDQKIILIKLFNNQKEEIAKLELSITELFDKKGNLLITSFTKEFDEGRNCDIYTSTLILKKYNFKYYYIEYNYNYEVKFGFDNYNPEPKGSYGYRKLFDVIIILFVVGLALYVIYYHYFKDKDDDEFEIDEFDIYQEMQQRPSISLNHYPNGHNQLASTKI